MCVCVCHLIMIVIKDSLHLLPTVLRISLRFSFYKTKDKHYLLTEVYLK